MATYDFLMVPPVEMADALLTSSTVYEAVVTAYDAGTTYAANDVRGTTAGTVQSIYRSLQAGNVGHTQASSPLWWEFIGIVYAAYNALTTYAADDIVSSISTDVHKLYKSVVGSNTGNALTDVTKWLYIGTTNRWKMFDGSYQSQTENAESIVVVLAPGEIVNVVYLGNVDGVSATVTQTISGYSRTQSLQRHPVNNWYDWYYEPLISVGDISFTDIPPHKAASLTITITYTGNAAKCGVCKVGKRRRIGITHDDLVRKINDYSRANEDDFGNVDLTVGGYSKRLTVNVQMDAGMESEIARLLEAYRATALIFIAAEDVAMAQIYGFLGPWSVPMASSGKPASIEIKGLT